MKDWNSPSARVFPCDPFRYVGHALYADKAAMKADSEGNGWIGDMHRKAAIRARQIVADAIERGERLGHG